MSTYYSHLFGDTSRFAIDMELHHPDGSKVGDYDYGHWGRFKFWVNGKNLTATTNSQGDHMEMIDWDISDLLKWLASNLEYIFTEEDMPIPESEAGSASAISQFWREDDVQDIELKIRQRVYEWWSRHAIRTGSCGGIFPNIIFRRRGDDMEISWDSRKCPYSDLTFVEAQGMTILPIDEVDDVLSSFLRETVDAVLKERPEDPDVEEIKSLLLNRTLLMDDE